MYIKPAIISRLDQRYACWSWVKNQLKWSEHMALKTVYKDGLLVVLNGRTLMMEETA